MKLRRWAALLLVIALLCSALPTAALAAGCYAWIDDIKVESTDHVIYGSKNQLYLDEIKVEPDRDYYEKYDFCEDKYHPEEFIRDPEDYALRNGDSVYLLLYRDEHDYNGNDPLVIITLTYSNEEFRVYTKPDSIYTFGLKDFDPNGSYGLKDQTGSGILSIESLPDGGTLYLNNEPVRRGAEVSLYDISRSKLVYVAPKNAGETEDYFEFSVQADRLTLIDESVMYITLTDENETELPVNAEQTLKLERSGGYTFSLEDFDYYKNSYDIHDFSYICITTLPEFGYIEYEQELIRTSTAIPLADIEEGKLTYTLDNSTDYASVAEDQFKYKVYTNQRNPVYTGTLTMDLSLFSAAGYSYVVKTDTRGGRTFRLSDFNDADGEWTAAEFTSTSAERDGVLTLINVPIHGSLVVDSTVLRPGDDVYLDIIRQGLLKYVPDSSSDSTPDSFKFLLSDARGTALLQEEMYIDRTAVRTGVVSYYDEDALVVWMTGQNEHTFTLDDLDKLPSNQKLEDFHNAGDHGSDGYLEILTIPGEGKLSCDGTALKARDVVALDDIVDAKLCFSRDSSATDAYTSFTFRVYNSRGQMVSDDAVTVYIDYYESDPYIKGSYSYTVNKATKTVQVVFKELAVSEDSVSAELSAGDLTDLAAEAGFTGGTLELAADVKDGDLEKRHITIDASLFTDSSKRSVFSTISVVATDAGQSTSGNAITNVWELSIPVESITALYVMSTADFSIELEKYRMTEQDKTSLPNKTYNGGLARRVTFYVGNTKVNLSGAALTLPYGKINNKPGAVVMMIQQSDGSFAPALSSTYNADSSVTAYCVCGMVCIPYYRGADSGMSFSDLGDPSVSWASNYIYSLAARNVVNGTGGTNYSPTAEVTRAEFIKMLVGSLGLYDASASCSFTDIKASSSAWAYAYVASAVKAGIIADGTSFDPAAPLDRQTMALWAYQAADQKAADITLPTTYAAKTFKDAAEIAAANRTAVTAMQRAGILEGDDLGNFSPNGTTTRAAAAKIICMLMEYKYQ